MDQYTHIRSNEIDVRIDWKRCFGLGPFLQYSVTNQNDFLGADHIQQWIAFIHCSAWLSLRSDLLLFTSPLYLPSLPELSLLYSLSFDMNDGVNDSIAYGSPNVMIRYGKRIIQHLLESRTLPSLRHRKKDGVDMNTSRCTFPFHNCRETGQIRYSSHRHAPSVPPDRSPFFRTLFMKVLSLHEKKENGVNPLLLVQMVLLYFRPLTKRNHPSFPIYLSSLGVHRRWCRSRDLGNGNDDGPLLEGSNGIER